MLIFPFSPELKIDERWVKFAGEHPEQFLPPRPKLGSTQFSIRRLLFITLCFNFGCGLAAKMIVPQFENQSVKKNADSSSEKDSLGKPR